MDFAGLLIDYSGMDCVDGLATSHGDGVVRGLIDGKAALFEATKARVPKFDVIFVVLEELVEGVGDFGDEVEKGKLFLI